MFKRDQLYDLNEKKKSECYRECPKKSVANKNVDSDHFENISKITRSKEACDILEKYYEGSENVKQVKFQSPRRKYEPMMMEEDQRINNYFIILLFV